MTLSAITAPQTAPGSKADIAQSQLAQDHEKFIKLLVAQVQNQDPLSPMDGTEFVSQLAQLTQVEQSVAMNKSLEALTSTISISAALNQTSLVGREVTTVSETFILGPVGGSFSYEFEKSPAAVSAIITDASGKTVRQIDGLSTESGKVIDVTWDGVDDSGNFAPEGEYMVTIATPDGSGGYNTYATSVVESVEFAGGVPVLRMADGRYASSSEIVRAK